jgi:hypothetical protein
MPTGGALTRPKVTVEVRFAWADGPPDQLMSFESVPVVGDWIAEVPAAPSPYGYWQVDRVIHRLGGDPELLLVVSPWQLPSPVRRPEEQEP